MPNKKYTKPQQKIAQEILLKLKQEYKVVKANDASQLFHALLEYINQTYLSEEQ